MKFYSRTTIKFLIFLSLFLFFGQTLSAQEPLPLEAERLYQKYIDNYQSNDPEKLKIALEAAKEYVELSNKKFWCSDITAYFNEAIPALEKEIKSKSAVSNQNNQCKQITFDYLFAKLKSASTDAVSKEKVLKELKSEIIERKVFFDLNSENEKLLISVGANDSLIKAVRENKTENSELEADSKKLYEIFTPNEGKTLNAEELNQMLEFIKMYVKKYEYYECDNDLIKYLKEAVSAIENQISASEINKERTEKNNEKYRILKEITDKFNAKNWAEVFSLSRQVYEIDPEFVPIFTDLASLGFEQAKLYGKESKYNAETVFYAELAVKLMENSKKDFGIYGGLGYSYKTKAEALVRMKEILDFMKTQNLSEPKNQ